MPTPIMYLPFEDRWPTPLSPETYRYDGHWPGKGESRQALIDRDMTAPYIGDALSSDLQGRGFSQSRNSSSITSSDKVGIRPR